MRANCGKLDCPAPPPVARGSVTGVSGVAGANEVELSWVAPADTCDPALSFAGPRSMFIAGKQGIASGYGFQSGSEAEVWLTSDPIYLGTTDVEADGTWTLAFDVPADQENGEHTIQAEGIAENDEPGAISAGVVVASATDLTLAVPLSEHNVVLFPLLFVFVGLLGAVKSRSISE